MLKVNSLKELRAQQTSLRIRKSILEAEMKESLADLKAEFSSVRAVSKNAEDVLASKSNTILGFSLGNLADFLTEKVLLRNSGLITKLVVPYIVKAATSNLVENNKSKIMGWLGNLTGKLAGRKA